MKFLIKVYEEKWVIFSLTSKWLVKQYIAACKKLTNKYPWKLDFKERKPTSSWVWSFRINKQFRALWYRRGDNFIVVEIDNHQ